MVENIYRHLSSGEYPELPLKARILHACHEVEKPLLFSTLIMVCAFLPLFTMTGPEGQIFGPMAQTYAFALGGALMLAVLLAPVLCLFFFKHLQPTPDNFLVRYLKASYLRMLDRCLRHRWLTLGLFGVAVAATVLYAIPHTGREFMPELEEGNLWIRGTFPLNMSLDQVADDAGKARAIIASSPEVESVVPQIGRPDDGTDPTGFYNVEVFVPLRPEKDWPRTEKQTGWRRWLHGARRARTKEELVAQMNAELNRKLPGVDWNFSQNIRDNVMEALSGVKGDNSVKIFGPDLHELERVANKVKDRLKDVKGLENVGVFSIEGQTNLEFRVDLQKCKQWGVSAADVNNVIQTALAGRSFTTMIEGEKQFDVTVRWPKARRDSETAILEIPVDISDRNQVVPSPGPGPNPNPSGTGQPPPPPVGSQTFTGNPITNTPRLTLRKFVSPVGRDGGPLGFRLTDAVLAALGAGGVPEAVLHKLAAFKGRNFETRADVLAALARTLSKEELERYQMAVLVQASGADSPGGFERAGASTIYREQGERLIAVKFSVHGRDLGSAVAEAREKTSDLLQAPYRAEWSGEFQEMEEAEGKLMVIIPASLGLIFLLLYLAFRSIIDALVVLANVVALSLGGIWALLLTGTNFSISAAVGFISIFGVAIMDGLLLVSFFNQYRAQGMPLREAILHGGEKRVRAMLMTDLTAVFGLLPAAFSTRIGAQTQRPLAIVVVGGMITTLLVARYLMPVLYSFYGYREPPSGAGSMAH
jgi:cobalt-zinc-cadmium resistance protein CzcA